MSNLRRVPVIICVVLVLLLALTSVPAAAKQLQVSSVSNGGAGETLYVMCNESVNLDAYTIALSWDPAVMNVTAVTNEQAATFPIFFRLGTSPVQFTGNLGKRNFGIGKR